LSHRIRAATPDDVADVFAMICELAEYERSRHEVQSTPQLLHDALFADDPAVWCSVIEHVDEPAGVDAGAVTAGFAIWFRNFFTWTAKHSIYLDDLYVRPQFRGLGYGKALLAHLAQVCVQRGYPRLDWWVLDWNPAVEFYRGIGAIGMDDWTVFRLTGEPLRRLAAGADAAVPGVDQGDDVGF
jgi:GNAT superfamily N-acetyltransferase